MLRCLFILLCLPAARSFGQTDTVEQFFAFRITGYTVKLNDSVTVVQVNMPSSVPLMISNEQLGVLKPLFRSDEQFDTTLIGWGKCHLIKEDYYYFAVQHNKSKTPYEGDLLYAKLKIPCSYNGLLFKTGSHAIDFIRVNEDKFYSGNEMFSMSKTREIEILDSMVNDIRNTGRVMMTQMPAANMDIKGGIYRNRKLFHAMQLVKRNELEEFLRYIISRPGRYAGNSWKISEIYATWMVSNTPTK
jgi:hypothetical protein